ncbi:Na-translocating system protein MpsC family protein [Sporosalibacterium faouarense]|uniref:Na-translocating system protein MpsC family protein n=1 Tax=Sporosalibacterium faouarense TaxID=516123 RepID=UPI00141D0D7A|nr:Na-translocating system protein MpsC family protein [Sporosalibacterium faouarense]MTI48265.1 response regulator [Bacillota bacterium]
MNRNTYKSILNNIKVLFVEDEDFARKELAQYIRKRVGKLYVASNGLEGLKQFDTHIPDLIITDLKMPEMTGLEFITSIREQGHEVPIIIISALSDSSTILEAVDMGIVKYVVKPIDTKELINTMEKIASELLKDKLDESIVVNKSFVMNREEKKELERKISGEMAYFIKKYTGKGPQNIQVFIKGNEIEIVAKGVLTILEENLTSSNRNHSLVNYNRRLLYLENKERIEEKLGEIINSKVSLLDVEIDSKQNIDILNLSFL